MYICVYLILNFREGLTEFCALRAFKTMLFTAPQPSRLQKHWYLPLRPAKDCNNTCKNIVNTVIIAPGR